MRGRSTIILHVLPLLSFLLISTTLAHGGILDWIRPPTLSEDQKAWVTFERNLAGSGEAIQVLDDGYKMIKVYRQEAQKKNGKEIPAQNMVEWGWKMTLRNTARKNAEVCVEYLLVDKDGFQVGYGSVIPWPQIKPGQTITLQEMSAMPYEDVSRVSTSTAKFHIYLKDY